jgi:lipopolysaccharide transport system ATP-binding protein
MHDKQLGELLLDVKQVSKKFCKSLRSSMLYGLRDLFLPEHHRLTLRKDEFWALRDVSLQLRRGETLAILGLNGAGKSTLMHLITGAFPTTMGSVNVNGRITTIYEKNAALKKFYTGRENVRVKCALYGLQRNEMEDVVDKILDFAEITDFADATFGTYSAGMKARVNFATACLCNPDIIVIDEGLSTSDSQIVDKYTTFLEEQRQNIGVLLVSHNIQLIRSLATHVIILKDGQVFHHGKDIEAAITMYTTTKRSTT